MSSFLELKDLSYSFDGQFSVLDGVNFCLEEGELTILAGRNGSGKTLLMKHLNGLVSLQKGEMYFQGEDLQGNKEIRRQIGLVFQHADSQFVAPTVYREIAFGPANLRMPKEEIHRRCEEQLKALRIEHLRDRNPHSLSGGEKRRVAMASILAMEPSLLVLDEPFTGLDLPGVEQVIRSLLDLKEQGCTLLVISHDLEKCLAHADRVLVLEEGKIVLNDSPRNVLPQLSRWDIYSPWQKDRPLESYTWLRSQSE